ncbi:MAG TPA: hypothetical protein VJS41_00560 [Stellaceae bacterium]|nr:hypothetical protein [Stellaceae bacterium]
MWFKRGVATLAAFLLTANTAFAASSCFQKDAYEAWQAVRYMTELMVLNDTCRVHVYEGFIKQNFAALDSYHKELVAHFRDAGDRHPEDTVDRYVTHAANEVSEEDGQMSTAELCSQKASYFATAQSLAGVKFHQFVADLVNTQKSDFRPCVDEHTATSAH